MRQMMTDLCALLTEQRDVLRNMLELAKEERDIIVSAKSELLENVIRLEFKELSKFNNIEKKRLALMHTIAAEMGIAEDELAVSKIAELAEPDEREAIRVLQEELTPLIHEHAAINKENRALIETQIDYSKMMLEIMVGEEDPLNNMYSGDGRAAPERKKATGLFDGHA